MWPPSAAADGNSHSKTKARLSSSSYSSSSFSRSSSSSSSVAVPQTPKRKTMEEVWKDINLPTLAQETQPQGAASGDQRHFFRSMILQDFLASAFKSPPRSAVASELPQLPLPLPPTALSLRSGLGCPHGPPNLPHHASPPFSLSSKKQPLDDAPSCNSKGDRHHKRMMKNRESAARSRARKQARKLLTFVLLNTDRCIQIRSNFLFEPLSSLTGELMQAYTNELELEVAHRAEENAKLKKQNEELRVAMAAHNTKKDFLQRTSSAPF